MKHVSLLAMAGVLVGCGTQTLTDAPRVAVIGIDIQPTFVYPNGELPVAGAVADTARLVEFIDTNQKAITQLYFTLDTHTKAQIFHPAFWVNAAGDAPEPYTIITKKDLTDGTWTVNPEMAQVLEKDLEWLNQYAEHYVEQLAVQGKYDLTVWPYHGMVGTVNQQLEPTVAAAAERHANATGARAVIIEKGQHPLTENYSAFRPKVTTDHQGKVLNADLTKTDLMDALLTYDAIILAGQAKSHCVGSSVGDLLAHITETNPELAAKVYLLEDATSPVVTPVVDYTDAANDLYATFAAAGMHRVTTQTPMADWPAFPVAAR